MKQEVHVYIQMEGRWLLVWSPVSDRWEVIHTELVEKEDISMAVVRALRELFLEKVVPDYMNIASVSIQREKEITICFVRVDHRKDLKSVRTISTENLIENIKHLSGYGTEYKEIVIQFVKDEAQKGYF